MIPSKKLEIFCGTGGVGKTTTSTSRALFLALEGKRCLLVTIDPAKRLKQILGIKSDQYISQIDLNILNDKSENKGQLDVILLNPRVTLERILKQEIKNDILLNLSKPYGGLNEIMAVLEIKYQLSLNKYDTIVLDTPPGKHFIDFLDASGKIKTFFDKSFAEIFLNVNKSNKSRNFLTKIVSSGIDKLLGYLESVTGKSFVNEFIEAIHLLYQQSDEFIRGIDLKSDLLSRNISNWFLVTSSDQLKEKEAKALIETADNFMHEDNFIIINKSWNSYLSNWKAEGEINNKLKNKLIEQDKMIKKILNKKQNEIIELPEIFENDPLAQVKALISNWK